MFLLQEKVSDSRGFNFTITEIWFNRVEVEVDKPEEAFTVDAHLKALEWYSKLLGQLSLKKVFGLPKDFDFTKNFDLETLLKQEVEKFNKQLENTTVEWRKWWEKMPGEIQEEPCSKFSDLFDPKQKELKKLFQDFFDDFCTLTITTKGAEQEGKPRPEIKTEIKLSGDITSTTNLSDDKLVAYHERMLTVSVNIVKSYIQVIIQIIGIVLPLAGVASAGSETFKGVTEIIKSFNVKET
jgi:hypothetical protein